MLNLILDLDNTLISAESIEEYDIEHNKEKSSKFNIVNMDDFYVVFERPGLEDFLDFIFKNFNVSVWTAASLSYCLFIVENIILKNKPERKLDYIFFSYHVNASKKIKNQTKSLALLWDVYKLPNYNQNNTLILDDYDEVYNSQKNNCIFMKAFEFTDEDSENDNFLSQLQDKIQTYINKDTKDVQIICNNINTSS